MNIVKYIIIVLVSFGLLQLANANIEQSDLKQINAILSRVYPLIADAKAHQAKQARVQVCYACLRQDINQVQLGITQAIEQQNLQPRQVQPLHDDYLK